MTTETHTSQQTNSQIKITIERLDVIADWNYKVTSVTNHICTLCKRDILAPSYDNLTKGKLDTKISLGKCKHCFHSDCIETLRKTKSTSSCPICYTSWNQERELDANTFHRQLKPVGVTGSATSTGPATTGTTIGSAITDPVLKKVKHKATKSSTPVAVVAPPVGVCIAPVTAVSVPVVKAAST